METLTTLKKGQSVELTIDSASFGGQGIARLDDFVIFVEGAIPGDRVSARITKLKKNFGEARRLEFLSPSPNRVPYPCAHFGVCGGCKWQDVDYQAQLEFKRQNVADVFSRIGGFPEIEILKPLGSPNLFHYRNKMEFTFGDTPWRIRAEEVSEEKFILGMHVPQRFDKILNIDECFLQSPRANDVLNWVKQFARDSGLPAFSVQDYSGFWRFLVIRETVHTKQILVNVLTTAHDQALMKKMTAELIARFPDITSFFNGVTNRKSQVAFADEEFLLHGPPVIVEKLGSWEFEISPNSFFQTNTLSAEILYETIREFAELSGHEVVYDLYCGTGSIAIYLSDQAKKIYGVELVESSVKNAAKNALHNRVNNCEFFHGDLRLTMNQIPEKPDVIILDPPRSGTHPDVIETLLKLNPPKIVYVSCNPSTQARDLAMMKEQYVIARVQPVDMFPHTYHIENIVRLERRV